jgi:hypothetical protein
MNLKTVGAVAVVLLSTPGVAGAQASSHSTDAKAVTVRIYNNFGVSANDLLVARAQAEAILHDAGIEVAWMDCWVGDHEAADASPACHQAPGGNSLVLRLQENAAADRARYVSMGYSLVTSGREAAYLSTVFPNVVWTVAHGAAIDPSPLLGLAIAHEIGHLLLNTNKHAETGLMRAGWSRTEMHRHVASDWRFLGSEAATMRDAVEARGTATRGAN